MKRRSAGLPKFGARARTAVVVLAGAAMIGAVVAACSTDGFTPRCEPEGGDCFTPPGDAQSENPIIVGGDAGTGG